LESTPSFKPALRSRAVHFTALVLASLAVGCLPPLAYRPRISVVDEVGLPEAQRRLSETLARAIAPSIASVKVTEECLEYRSPKGSAFPREVQLYFANLTEVEIFTNHYVFLWGIQRQVLDRILFPTEEDARTFADLVMSFRDRRLRSWSDRI
jgi:hypothetical protein